MLLTVIIVVLCIYAYLCWLRYKRILTINAIPQSNIHLKQFLDVLQPGDIVYMSSRYLPFNNTDVSNVYSVVSSALLGTPFYHVFIVLKDKQMVHFVKPSYYPKLNKLCGNVYVGDIDYYVRERQVNAPLYNVLRRSSQPVVFDDDINHLCNIQFPSFHSIALSMFFPSTLPSDLYAHCNSYVGLLLEKKKLLPRVQYANQAYVPSRLLHEFLPKAGYTSIGVFNISM